MTSLSQHILAKANELPEGGLLSSKEFLHLGTRGAVDRAFSRLAREGKLLRVERGTYALPVQGKFGERPPSPGKLLEALAARTREELVSSNAIAANRLGLTTQVPVREIFLTSGKSRELQLGLCILTLQHAPGWQLLFGESPAGTLLRALAWLGPKQAKEILPRAHELASAQEWGSLAAVRPVLPGWLAEVVSKASINTLQESGVPRLKEKIVSASARKRKPSK